MAYTSTVTGRSEVYVAPLDGGVPVPVSNAGGLSPAWSETGDTLYYYPLGAGTDLTAAALAFDGAPRVLSRGLITTIVPLVEVNTLPAQYDVYPGGIVSVLSSQSGNRIVVRTNYLPSGD